MEKELRQAFNAAMQRNLDNRDASLNEALPLSEGGGYELCFQHFGHIDGNVLQDLERIGRRWGTMRLMEVSGTNMRWLLREKSTCKCSANWYNILGLLLSYTALVCANPQRWRP